MAQARKAHAAPSGLLCAHNARAASLFRTPDPCVAGDVLLCEAATLACYVDLLASLLLCPGDFHRTGRATRVSQGTQAQLELARSDDHGHSLLPISVYPGTG